MFHSKSLPQWGCLSIFKQNIQYAIDTCILLILSALSGPVRRVTCRGIVFATSTVCFSVSARYWGWLNLRVHLHDSTLFSKSYDCQSGRDSGSSLWTILPWVAPLLSLRRSWCSSCIRLWISTRGLADMAFPPKKLLYSLQSLVHHKIRAERNTWASSCLHFLLSAYRSSSILVSGVCIPVLIFC